MSTTTVYRDMSAADKEALKELKAYMETKTGKPVTLADAISAVSPELATPLYLIGV